LSAYKENAIIAAQKYKELEAKWNLPSDPSTQAELQRNPGRLSWTENRPYDLD
jgi:hypothetical protein